MTSAKEVISVDRNYSADEMESIVFMLIGNKLDLADDDNRRYMKLFNPIIIQNDSWVLLY